ncbi:LytR C-terminal domain-containing protein [Candidatus Berkelbacteria bacterium]|nr:LytR C-terminal domain-containing protein [Candidatus Berkelbacteria bacterium]
MPKGFDISASNKRPALYTPPVQTETVQKPQHHHAYYRRWYVLLLLVIIAVIILLVQFKYESLQVIIGDKQNNTPDQVKTVVDSTNLEQSLKDLFSQGENEVSVYRSGASTEIIEKVISQLETEGFTVTDLGASQRKYDKAYIWFNQNNEAAAIKIEQILSSNGYAVEKRQATTTDIIDLIVYLGDKN